VYWPLEVAAVTGLPSVCLLQYKLCLRFRSPVHACMAFSTFATGYKLFSANPNLREEKGVTVDIVLASIRIVIEAVDLVE